MPSSPAPARPVAISCRQNDEQSTDRLGVSMGVGAQLLLINGFKLKLIIPWFAELQ